MADSGWAKCSWGKMYGQWIGGLRVRLRYGPLSTGAPVEKLEKYRVTVLRAAEPSRFMIRENMESYDLSSLERCTTAGEPLNPEVFNKVKQMLGLEIAEGFGQSETTPIMASL